MNIRPGRHARFYAGDDPSMTCGLTVAEIPGVAASALQGRLRKTHGILVQAMTDIAHSPSIRGVRFSPNVYTSPTEMDRLARALAEEVAALRKGGAEPGGLMRD